MSNVGLGSLDLGSQLTAFGEASVSEPTPQVQLHFTYNINSSQLIAFPGNGGTIGNGNDHANMSTGTNADGFASLLSRDVLKLNAGQGGLARFSGIFTTGVADSEQVIGCGNGLNGFFFGYNGADFGVLQRYGGAPELRQLEVTTGSTNDEDVTITLDGIAVTNVTVSNSGDPTVTAREIADHSYAGVGTGWGARVAGNKVLFISIEPTSKSGAYSLSGATSAVGTFSQIGEGIEPTNLWFAQTAWSEDTMDGNGSSGMDLDTTKGNEYQIRFQWGYGAVSFYIEDNETGTYKEVHRIKHGNSKTSPITSNPSFPMFAMATNKGNTSNLTIKTASLSAFTEGIELGLGTEFTALNLLTITNTNETPVLTIRNKQIFQNIINQVRLSSMRVTLTSNLANNNATVIFKIYTFARPETGTVYTDVNTNGSVVEIDTSSTSFNLQLAQLRSTFIFEATNTDSFPIGDEHTKISPATTLMITAEISNSNPANVVGATINWRELF